MLRSTQSFYVVNLKSARLLLRFRTASFEILHTGSFWGFWLKRRVRYYIWRVIVKQVSQILTNLLKNTAFWLADEQRTNFENKRIPIMTYLVCIKITFIFSCLFTSGEIFWRRWTLETSPIFSKFSQKLCVCEAKSNLFLLSTMASSSSVSAALGSLTDMHRSFKIQIHRWSEEVPCVYC